MRAACPQWVRSGHDGANLRKLVHVGNDFGRRCSESFNFALISAGRWSSKNEEMKWAAPRRSSGLRCDGRQLLPATIEDNILHTLGRMGEQRNRLVRAVDGITVHRYRLPDI